MKIDSNSRSVDLDPQNPQFYENPYAAYETFHRQLRVFKWEQYGYWCLASHEDVNALLRDRRFGRQILHVATREELGLADVPARLKPFYDFEQHSLLELEPPVHSRLRGLVSRAFLSRQVERLRPKIESLCNSLIDGFEAKREIELLSAYATPVPVIVICELLGVPTGMAGQFLEWSHDMVAMYMARRDFGVEEAAVKATLQFSHYMRSLIAERRRRPQGDLLSELVKAESEGQKLSEDELVTTAIVILNAGHEATVHTIGNGVKALLQLGLTGEITEPVIEEIMRYDAPLHLFTRYALEDIEFGGVKFRKGEEVGLLLGAANRDPARFSNPGQFIPERNPNPHVSFGAGIHFCIGAPLARLEMLIAFQTLFKRLPKMRLVSAPHYKDAYHFHGLDELRVAF